MNTAKKIAHIFVFLLITLMFFTGCSDYGGDETTPVTFDSADTRGDQVDVSTGGVDFKMSYANDQTSITFPFSPSIGTPVDNETETINHKFFMGQTQVTWALWKAVYDWAVHGDRGTNVYAFQNPGQMGNINGDAAITDQHPVTMVSWRDAIIWCNALSEMTGSEVVYVANGTYGTTDGDVLRTSIDDAYSGNNVEDVVKSESDNLIRTGYRLPTSKEWEYSARYVGTDADGRTDYVSQDTNGGHADLTEGYFWTPAAYASGGTDSVNFDLFAWYGDNTGDPKKTQPVGQKPAAGNGLVLYDMSGNVWEWCFTLTVDYGYNVRVIRGGSWSNSTSNMQVGYWNYKFPFNELNYVGFRFARTK